MLTCNHPHTSHTPSHGTREVLIIYGALLSSDPGDIHDTIASLVTDRIRVSIVGLAAEVAICAEICARTNGGDRHDGSYAVALHEQHFRELFLAATTPPATTTTTTSTTPTPGKTPDGDKGASATATTSNTASLLMMGFPSRALAPRDRVSLCACHSRPSREGYSCTRCRAKVCRLPAECPACGLTLVLSTHLARSYHHLFPLRAWTEVSWADAARSKYAACYACLAPFPPVPRGPGAGASKGAKGKGGESAGGGTATAGTTAAGAGGGGGGGEGGKGGGKREAGGVGVGVGVVPEAKPVGVSESGRYACPVCGNHFCIDCDVFAHEVIHNCPGCQSDTRGAAAVGAAGSDGDAVTGQDAAQAASGEAMVVDS